MTRRMQTRIENRDEGCGIRNLLQRLVEILHNRGRSAQLPRATAYRLGERRHQKRGCSPLPETSATTTSTTSLDMSKKS
jgi:hypothetical protein